MAEDTKELQPPLNIIQSNALINSAVYSDALNLATKDFSKNALLLYRYSTYIIYKVYSDIISKNPLIDINEYVFSFSMEEFTRYCSMSENNHSFEYELCRNDKKQVGHLILDFLLDNGDRERYLPHYTLFDYDKRNDRFYFTISRRVLELYTKKIEDGDSHRVNIATYFSFRTNAAGFLYQFVNGISQLPEFKYNPKIYVPLDLLRKVMCVTGYVGNFPGFKQRKLQPAQEEIREISDLSFSFKEEYGDAGEIIGITIFDVKRKSGTVEVIDDEVTVIDEELEIFKLTDQLNFTNTESAILIRLSGYNYRLFKQVIEMYNFIKKSGVLPLETKAEVYAFFEQSIKKTKETFDNDKLH